MTEAETSFVVLGVAALAAQVFLTVRVWRSSAYVREQKMAQTRLIWLVPIIGAMLVVAMMPPEDDIKKKRRN